MCFYDTTFYALILLVLLYVYTHVQVMQIHDIVSKLIATIIVSCNVVVFLFVHCSFTVYGLKFTVHVRVPQYGVHIIL